MASSELMQSVPLFGTEAYFSGIRQIAEYNIGLQDQVADNANVAFRDCRPNVIVSQPVAMHDESDFIYASLDAFRRSHRSQRPLVLSCNAPTRAQDSEYDRTMSEIDRFRCQHPEFPLSYYETRYANGTPIGEIRMHNVGVAIGALVDKYGFAIPADTLVVNADADTVSTPYNYLDTMHDEAAKLEHPELAFVYPGLRNATSEGLLPNMDAVMTWSDIFRLYGEKYPDAHTGFGLGFYLAANQYDPTCSFGETTELLARARDALGELIRDVYIGPDAAVVVSGRHEYHQMAEGDEPHFEPVRTGENDYRHADFRGADISFGSAYSQIDLLRIAEIPNMVLIQADRLQREKGMGMMDARLAAIAYTRRVLAEEAKHLSTVFQMRREIEGQLDRLQTSYEKAA